MITLYDGIYSWDGKKHDGRDPIAWFPGAYYLKIFDLTTNQPGVSHLRNHLCIYTETGRGYSVSAKPEKFAKHICADFTIEMERTLWVEQCTDGSNEFMVIQFSRTGTLGEENFYQVKRRPANKGEQQIIGTALGITFEKVSDNN